MNRASIKKLLQLSSPAGFGIIAALATAALGAATLVGCNNQPPATTETADHQHADGKVHDHTDTGAPATQGGLTARNTKLEFKTQPKKIIAGEPAIWTLKIFDKKTNDPVRNFDTVHEKMLHLIVVSKDLSWFSHIHPEYKDYGLFITRTSVPRVGTYKLYADYTPKDGTQEVAQQEFSTDDIPQGSFVQPSGPTQADKVGTGGWIMKQAVARPEGEPDDLQAKASGPLYQVALMPMPGKIVAGKAVTLHFQVRDAAGKYVSDLEPYLGAMGHLVVLSSDTNIYLHAHPMDDIEGMDDMKDMNHTEHPVADKGGPDVMFHTNFPTAGIYKAWGQFKHKGLIITAPFVLRVEAGAHSATTAQPVAGKQAAYYCPMHPEVTSNDPKATCPKCGGMELTKRA